MKAMRAALAAVVALAPMALATLAAQAAELRVGYSSDITTLDPANHRSRVTEGVIHNMYDAVVTRTDDMKVVPEIAQSFTQIDATTYEAKIRPNISFHDGSPLTAEDVKFTFDRIVDPASKSLQVPRIGPYQKSEVVDEYTVKVYFKEPFPSFLSNLSEVALAPCSPDAVKKLGDKYSRFPVAAGPFKVKDWPDDNTVVLGGLRQLRRLPAVRQRRAPGYRRGNGSR